jgi:hypothetical protein
MDARAIEGIVPADDEKGVQTMGTPSGFQEMLIISEPVTSYSELIRQIGGLGRRPVREDFRDVPSETPGARKVIRRDPSVGNADQARARPGADTEDAGPDRRALSTEAGKSGAAEQSLPYEQQDDRRCFELPCEQEGRPDPAPRCGERGSLEYGAARRQGVVGEKARGRSC